MSAAVPWVLPLIVPVALLAVTIAYAIARDSEPTGLGEPTTGLIPGATTVSGWQTDASVIPDGFGPRDPGYPTPEALVDAMVTQARRGAGGASWIRGTVESASEDAAMARVYLPPPEASDAWAGSEVLLELTRKPDGWHALEAHVRFHCQRAVRNGLCI